MSKYRNVEATGKGGSCSFGCLDIILTLFIVWALFWKLSTPWGLFSIDIFPPAIHLEK